MNSKFSLNLAGSGIACFLIGLIFYACVRPDAYPILPHFASLQGWKDLLPEVILGSLPSFLHVAGLGLISVALQRIWSNKWIPGPAFWLIINLVFEFGQLLDEAALISSYLPGMLSAYLVNGTFDWNDLLFCVLAFLLVLACQQIQPAQLHLKKSLASFGNGLQKLVATSFMGFGLLTLLATSYDQVPVGGSVIMATPIYMSYEEFRQSFEVQFDQEIENPGKIYVFNDLLLVSDVNRGVHIFDNSNPAEPQAIAFLQILGNHDIAVKDHILYADSYIDLLVIDLNDPSFPVLIQRMEEVFPWDPEQWFQESIFWLETLDRSRGVIVAYKPRET